MVEEGEEEGEEGEGERKSAQTKFYDRSKFSRSKKTEDPSVPYFEHSYVPKKGFHAMITK